MSDSSEGQEGIHHERQRNILTQPIDFLDPEECGDNEFDLNKEKDHSSGENIVTKSSGEQDDEEVGDELAAPTSDDDDSQAGQGLIEHHKKKKKKKKKSNHVESTVESEAVKQKRREGEKAFNAALKAISSNSEDALWVRLDGCMIEDHHISRLCAALENNTHILSLDLSGNQITDEGVFQICDCLAQGAAPDLIELSMRNIMIETDGEKSITNLIKKRKVLRVDVSAMQKVSGEDASGVDNEESKETRATGEQNSSLIQNIFQMGNEENIEGLSEEDSHRLDLEDECFRLWDEIIKYTSQDTDTIKSNLNSISENFFAVNEYLLAELNSCRLPLLEDTDVKDLTCFLESTLKHVGALDTCLKIEAGSGFVTPFSKSEPVPRVGSHRVLAASLAANVLTADCPVVSSAFQHHQIISNIMELSVRFPYCSILHSQALKIASVCVSSQSGKLGLWKQIITTKDGCPNDHVFDKLFDALESAVTQTPGRNPLSGFCIQLISTLAAACRTDDSEQETISWRNDYVQELGRLSGWKQVYQQASQESCLRTLLDVQQQNLGGPPPDKNALHPSFADQMQISGPQLLELLQNFNLNS